MNKQIQKKDSPSEALVRTPREVDVDDGPRLTGPGVEGLFCVLSVRKNYKSY